MKLELATADTSFDYKFILSRLYPYIKPLLFRVFITLALSIPLGLLDGAMTFAIKPYIDVVVNGNPWKVYEGLTLTRDVLVNAIPFAIVMFAIIQGALRYINTYLAEWLSSKISNTIKIDLFERFVKMDSSFYDENSSGMIIARFLYDPDTASRTVIESLKRLLTCATEALGLICVLLYTGWRLAIVGILVLGVAFIPLALIRKKIKEVSNGSTVIGGGIVTNFNETYHGNKIVTAYGLQDKMFHKFEGQVRQQFDLAMSLTKRVGWMSPIMYFIASIGIAIVMFYGNSLIIAGKMTTGSFASFVTSLLLLYKPVKDLGGQLTNLQGVCVAASRVFELFDIIPEIQNKENAKELKGIEKGISFNNVCFEYVKDDPVLKGVTFNVYKNQTVALVGNSGGGKSTIVNLIPRFYDVKSGSITIDDVDIRDYKLESLRYNIAEVFQDNFLFSGTIRDNILMGKFNATEEEIENAIKLAHVDEFINSLENGIDTQISENGTGLSGGQKQRVAIARAILKNAPIIILDEATSALDNVSEAIVQRALENLMKNKTVFVIAHRLSTIKNADKILVINEGHLVEEGSHNELMNIENGQYKALYDMQFRKEDIEN